MAFQILPVDCSPNQAFTSTLSISGKNMSLQFSLRYNETAGYWVMGITDPATGLSILDSIPLLTGDYPAADVLGQYAYLGIGSLYVINASGVAMDSPDDTNLGSDFLICWGS